MEVITVTGQRPLNYYRQQIKIEEKKFYKQYNSLVSDKRFKIKCDYVTKSGLYRGQEKRCEPSYMKKEFAERDFYFFGKRSPGSTSKYKKRTKQDREIP